MPEAILIQRAVEMRALLVAFTLDSARWSTRERDATVTGTEGNVEWIEVSPYQLPSFALENVLETYQAFLLV